MVTRIGLLVRGQGVHALRCCLAVLGLVFVFSGCAGRDQRRFVELDSYDMDDFEPFRKLLVEDEFAEHPELIERTVYHLQFTIGDPPSQISARARIRYTNQESELVREIPFFLYPNLTPGSLDVKSVTINDVAVEPEFRDRRSRLLARLPEPLEPAQSASIHIEYQLSLPATEEGEYGGFGYAGGVLSLAYSYPIIPAYAGWDHPLPVPYGDFIFTEVSFYLVQISMPEELILAAPGIELGSRQSEGRREVTVAMGPSRDLYMALGRDLVVQSEQVGKTEVRSFAGREEEAASRRALSTATAALGSLGERLGPYPYTTLTLVGVPFAAFGLEFPGIILLARRLYDLSQNYSGVPAPVLLEATTTHEVAHQWFYASVGNDQLLEPWLDEAPAQYATWLYYKDRYGGSAAQGFFQSLYERWDRVGRAQIPIGRPLADYTPKEYGAIVYGRGPLFIHALSEQMGEEVFDRFMKEYVKTYEWEIVDSLEFEATAEAACSCQLDDLFDQWVWN
ncbi:MAG: M1 family metallopeptidase [Spirochaetaceae bacterium]|nr:MAG: M1 family metallopeptidase [Spirochaetaceae bacterium]